MLPSHPRHVHLWSRVEPAIPPMELAHDRYHVLRVYGWALRLAPEAGASPDLCGAAGLVHDLVAIPKDSPERSLGGERSAAAAEPLLRDAGYDAAATEQILEAVRTSSWSRGLAPTNAVGVVLQDADRLDAIGALGIARTYACAQWFSRPDRAGRFYHPDDPLHESDRPLDDVAQATDHFFRKLLTLAGGMHLPTAREEARSRHAVMLRYLEALGHEVAGPGRA